MLKIKHTGLWKNRKGLIMTKKLFYNGDILTLEDELYAEAVLVEDGKIKAVGKKDELMSQNSDDKMIDLKGKTLMPSFIDAHSHFFGYANSKLQVSLEDAVDFEDIANRIKTFIEKNNVPCEQFRLQHISRKNLSKNRFLRWSCAKQSNYNCK